MAVHYVAHNAYQCHFKGRLSLPNTRKRGGRKGEGTTQNVQRPTQLLTRKKQRTRGPQLRYRIYQVQRLAPSDLRTQNRSLLLSPTKQYNEQAIEQTKYQVKKN